MCVVSKVNKSPSTEYCRLDSFYSPLLGSLPKKNLKFFTGQGGGVREFFVTTNKKKIGQMISG